MITIAQRLVASVQFRPAPPSVAERLARVGSNWAVNSGKIYVPLLAFFALNLALFFFGLRWARDEIVGLQGLAVAQQGTLRALVGRANEVTARTEQLAEVSNESVSHIKSLISLAGKTADVLGEIAPRVVRLESGNGQRDFVIGDIHAKTFIPSGPVDWLGYPMFSDGDRYTPSQGWSAHHKIGLRPDGVVVWRDERKVDARAFGDFQTPQPVEFTYRVR